MSSNWDFSTLVEPHSLEPVEGLDSRVYEVSVLDGAGKGKKIALDGTTPRLLVGKGPACDLQLENPHVSRRHAALELTPKGVRLTDLESSNGTTVDGLRIGEVYLQGGESIGMAGTTLAISRAAARDGDAQPAPMALEGSFGRMLGKSVVMRRLYPLCKRLAASELPVLIEGETGTGKEVLAEALHEASPRAAMPFVVFDCTAVPPSLAESTLFGHEKGSFTGAVSSRKGVFEEADGGTLFIDEIGELDLSLQPKLLRALERSEVQRVGSNTWTRIDARIIAATRRDLDKEVQAGRFRDDLFFRLAVGRIELPPLRHRRGDVGFLAEHFRKELGGKSPLPKAIVVKFEDYPWPGNLRELYNAVARFLALGEAPEGATHPSDAIRTPPTTKDERALGSVIEELLDEEMPLTRAREVIVGEFEKRYVERVLARYGGNVARAAAASGIARRYFQILRARYREP
jgi:two-component system, NtrC family, response regulator HydG